MLQITAIMISNIMLRSIRSSYTYSVIKVYCIVCYVCHANFKQKKQPNEYDAFFFSLKASLTYKITSLSLLGRYPARYIFWLSDEKINKFNPDKLWRKWRVVKNCVLWGLAINSITTIICETEMHLSFTVSTFWRQN